MLQAREGSQPLLRRPMSICRIPPGRGGRLEILYRVVGEGTRYLSRQPRGAYLRTLGPLGNGFRLPERVPARRSGRLPVLVSGGIGIAIFPFLVDALRERRQRPLLLYGARTRRDLVALDLFRARRVPARLATEDGSAGSKGLVTRLLRPLLESRSRREPVEVYACGPTPMLRAVAEMALRHGAPCQLALESHMPCGIGVCLGCVVRCAGSDPRPAFRRVCTEGPIFEASEVAL